MCYSVLFWVTFVITKSHEGFGGFGAGLTGILNNFDAYQRWVATTHESAQYVGVTYAKADMQCENYSAEQCKDLRKSEVKKTKKCVAKTTDANPTFLSQLRK